MKKIQQTKLKLLSINKLIPNAITMAALCSGMSAIRFAFINHWEAAVGCILLACILDTMDGRIARLLGKSSQFGAQLDSLADAVNFGVAPALMMYLYTLKDFRSFGWAITLFFVVCMVFRLARFNTLLLQTDQEKPANKAFFLGVPAPAGAILILLPIMLQFEVDISQLLPTFFYGIWVICGALLLISRIPTFSLKGGKIPLKFGWFLFVILVFLMVNLVTSPWTTITLLGGLYLASIPISYKLAQRGG